MDGWLIKNPMTRFYIIAGTVLFIFVITLAAVITTRSNSSKMCTLVGCIGGIEVEVVGLPESTPFEVSLAFPSGETQTLKCGGETDESVPFENVCSLNGAFFGLPSDVEPPEVIAVTVTTSAGQWKETIFPEYEEFLPNGEGCLPTCYNADIVINIES